MACGAACGAGLKNRWKCPTERTQPTAVVGQAAVDICKMGALAKFISVLRMEVGHWRALQQEGQQLDLQGCMQRGLCWLLQLGSLGEAP